MRRLILIFAAWAMAFGVEAQDTFIAFNDSWKYLDNGTDQGTAWRDNSFDDTSWILGHGKFGYGIPDANTIISFGPDGKNKYITTYFRKAISIADPSVYSSFKARIKRDDGLVVYVNGVELIRNNLPSGTINYTTTASNARDDGTATLSFDIAKDVFVGGDNVIAVEVHQQSKYTSDLTFDLELTASTSATDNTAPRVLSINRYEPLNEFTNANAVTYKVNFSEPVTGVDRGDFVVSKLSSTVNGQLAADAVSPFGTDGVSYLVTISNISGEGTLKLDLKKNITAIADLAGNPISGGFTSGQRYTIQLSGDETAPSVTSINRYSPLTEATTATAVTYQVNFSEPVTGVDRADFTINIVSGTVAGQLAADAVSAVGTDGSTYRVTISSLTGEGSLKLDLNGSGTGIVDQAGNPISGGFTAGQTYNFDEGGDQIAPSVSSINRYDPTEETTSATTLAYQVNFSEPVHGVDKNDFVVSKLSGTLSCQLAEDAVSPVGTDGSSYHVTISSITGEGTLKLDLKGRGTGITDLVGNPISKGFTSGQRYTIEKETQPTVGFTSVTSLTPLPIASNTSDRPQSKAWQYDGYWWSALADAEGTHIWRLDGASWTRALTLTTTTYGKADCKVVGNVVHIYVFRGNSTSHLYSVEYVPASDTYALWSQRTARVGISLGYGVETASMDIDGDGRMWIASDLPAGDGTDQVDVRWSDSPYTSWSEPITIAIGLNSDDISGIIALPGKIGVLWSNQNAKLFGFKTHTDGQDPAQWSQDEAPGSQSALNLGLGMADDHLNMVAASDGTLYCAIKTGYETLGKTKVGLLVRRPAGSWDNLYDVTTHDGTRPIVILNEAIGKLKVVYTDVEGGGNILYRESPTTDISFSSAVTLISGVYNFVTSSKDPYSGNAVILASNTTHAVGVLGIDETPYGTAGTAAGMRTAAITGEQFREEPTAYPNPFSSELSISFALPANGAYAIELFDSMGKQLSTSYKGTAVAGERNIIALEDLPMGQGLYFLRLTTDTVTKTLRIVRK